MYYLENLQNRNKLFCTIGLLWDAFPLVCLLDHGDTETKALLCLLQLLFLPSHNYEIWPEVVLVKHYNATRGTQISKSEADPSEDVNFHCGYHYSGKWSAVLVRRCLAIESRVTLLTQEHK
jgi:hypothetical protein